MAALSRATAIHGFKSFASRLLEPRIDPLLGAEQRTQWRLQVEEQVGRLILQAAADGLFDDNPSLRGIIDDYYVADIAGSSDGPSSVVGFVRDWLDNFDRIGSGQARLFPTESSYGPKPDAWPASERERLKGSATVCYLFAWSLEGRNKHRESDDQSAISGGVRREHSPEATMAGFTSATHSDGPGEDRCTFFWQGRCVQITRKPWELLRIVWGRDRVPYLELCGGENHVTGWDEKTPGSTIRRTINVLNEQLAKAGVHVGFETAGECVVRSF